MTHFSRHLWNRSTASLSCLELKVNIGSIGSGDLGCLRLRIPERQMLILTISDMRTMPEHQRRTVGCVRRIEATRSASGLSPRPAASATAAPPRTRIGAPRLVSSVNPELAPPMRRPLFSERNIDVSTCKPTHRRKVGSLRKGA